jgi:hypothetical protein
VEEIEALLEGGGIDRSRLDLGDDSRLEQVIPLRAHR